jgi:hypothetical protein
MLLYTTACIDTLVRSLFLELSITPNRTFVWEALTYSRVATDPVTMYASKALLKLEQKKTTGMGSKRYSRKLAAQGHSIHYFL